MKKLLLTFTAMSSQDNPIVRNLDISISLPKNIEIKMVNASTLNDYEMFMIATTILISSFVGFFVAFIQNTAQMQLLYFSLVLLVLSFISTTIMLKKRKQMTEKTRVIKLKIDEEIFENKEIWQDEIVKRLSRLAN